MELFNIVAGTCSILSLLISIFLATKLIKIEKSVNVKGEKNIVGGRDVNVKR